MQNKTNVLRIGEHELLVGMTWTEVQCKLKPLLPIEIRKEAIRTGLHYGVSNSVKKDDDRDLKALHQMALVNELETEDLNKPLSGALFVANNIKDWADLEKDTTAIFIKLNDNSIVDGYEFWITAVTERGEILGEWDATLQDQYLLIDKIEALSLTDNLHVVILSSEVKVKSIVESFFEKTGLTYPITMVNDITLMSLLEDSNNSAIKRFYKESKIKVERLGFAAGTIAISAAIFFGWSLFSQMDAMNYLSNEDAFRDVGDKEYRFDRLVSKSMPSKYWTDDEFKQVTLEQFVESSEKSIFSPLEVSLIFREIERTMPLYVSEWKFNKLVFVDNQFLAYYSRIQGSKGVYFLLDESVDIINESAKSLTIAPLKLTDQGDTRIYSILPSIEMDRKNEFQGIREDLAFDSKIRKQIKSAQLDAKNSYAALKNAYSTYLNLSFGDKWLKRRSLELFKDAQIAEARAIESEARFNKLIKLKNDTAPAQLDEKYVLGNVMDFVTMMQLDSFFEWSYPQGVRTYPDAKTLEEKTRKVKKKKSKSNKKSEKKYKVYSHAIESYTVEISTQETEEEGKVSSYGISDMLQLGFLINKPFVQIDLVEYEKESQQWRFVIHFNRKTGEYERTISGNAEANKG